MDVIKIKEAISKKIDCSITENYFKEKARMTNRCEYIGFSRNCYNCPISSSNNGNGKCCDLLEMDCPETAIAIVQKWSDEHPIMKNKDKFKEVMKEVFGADIDDFLGCPPIGRYKSKCGNKCSDCIKWWDEPYKEPERVNK